MSAVECWGRNVGGRGAGTLQFKTGKVAKPNSGVNSGSHSSL